MLESPFALLTPQAEGHMEFGLLPKISTPVQKPVEIRVFRRTKSRIGRFCIHFSHLTAIFSNNPNVSAAGR
jgi:hypothetical protein